MDLDFIISLYYIYRMGEYKINIYKDKFRKVRIDMQEKTLDIYIKDKEYDDFMRIIKDNKIYKD